MSCSSAVCWYGPGSFNIDVSPGVKFADAELIGAPVRLTIGKRTVSEGTVDLQARRGREQISTSVRDAPERAQAILQEGA